MIEIYFDGACEPVNPGGTASYGWVIKRGGKVLEQDGKIIGTGEGMTNNVAEYTGLIEAIKALPRIGAGKGNSIKIYGDSNLVCNIVSRKWGWNKKKTKWVPHEDVPHLSALLDKALSFLKDYDYEIKWIPREQNQEADALSKEVLIKAGIIKPESEREKCPKCAGWLVGRRGKLGEFFGCSNYPKCNHIQKLSK